VPAIKNKKLETLDTQGFQASPKDDSDWARTSDLHPVKVGVFLFHHENNLIKYPNKIPTIPKSESPNVVPSNPSEPRTGSKSAGKKEIKIPLANASKMAPRLPPVALPNTPAAASGEKVWN
jgi:hypothetical protein